MGRPFAWVFQTCAVHRSVLHHTPGQRKKFNQALSPSAPPLIYQTLMYAQIGRFLTKNLVRRQANCLTIDRVNGGIRLLAVPCQLTVCVVFIDYLKPFLLRCFLTNQLFVPFRLNYSNTQHSSCLLPPLPRPLPPHNGDALEGNWFKQPEVVCVMCGIVTHIPQRTTAAQASATELASSVMWKCVSCNNSVMQQVCLANNVIIGSVRVSLDSFTVRCMTVFFTAARKLPMFTLSRHTSRNYS